MTKLRLSRAKSRALQNHTGRPMPFGAAPGLIVLVLLHFLAATTTGAAQAQDASAIPERAGIITADTAHVDAGTVPGADEILVPSGDFARLEGSYLLINGDPQSGDTLHLESVRGKLVLLDFWASWCGPCIEEIPETNAFAAEFGGVEDFVFISVNQDALTGGGDAEYVHDFVRERGIEFPVLIDQASPSLKNVFAIRAWPTRIMIREDGEILEPLSGRLTLSTAAEYLHKRLDH